MRSIGYARELLRPMSGFSNFAISFSIICILAGGITSLQLGVSNDEALTVLVAASVLLAAGWWLGEPSWCGAPEALSFRRMRFPWTHP